MREVLIDTAHYPCGDRVGVWQQVLADHLAPFRVLPAPETPFQGQLRGRRLGPVKMVATTRTASVNHRPQRLIRSHTGTTRLSLSLLLAGDWIVIEDRSQQRLRPGDLVLWDLARPMTLASSTTRSALSFRTPSEVLGPSAEGLVTSAATVLPTSRGLGAMIALHLRQLAELDDDLRPDIAVRLGITTVDLLATYFADLFGAATSMEDADRRALLHRVKAHIEAHLGEPDLGPAMGAPQPDPSDLRSDDGYFVQRGPLKYGSTYPRFQGGSTLHWLGVCLRMLPEDFELRSRYGRDWPLGYEVLEPWYRQAERAIGVAADVAEQTYHGIEFAASYDYPMRRIPSSYSGTVLAAAIDGTPIRLSEDTVRLKVRSYPATRNSVPRGNYQPVGAVDIRPQRQGLGPYLGERCAGNTSCTPICPIQATYNAGKSLAQADPAYLGVVAQAVASKLHADPLSGQVRGVEYRRYRDPSSPRHTVHTARGRVHVLAAHAVENAKLMLASGLGGTSGMLGRNLMDHPSIYAWGLAKAHVRPYRGPLSTSGIDDYTLAGMAEATRVYREVFSRAGIEDRTDPEQGPWFPEVPYAGGTMRYHGMGHFAGTHVMGDDPGSSVVDVDQRWEHRNLFLVGAGSFPTMGTSNPTLTMAALALRTADRLTEELRR